MRIEKSAIGKQVSDVEWGAESCIINNSRSNLPDGIPKSPTVAERATDLFSRLVAHWATVAQYLFGS